MGELEYQGCARSGVALALSLKTDDLPSFRILPANVSLDAATTAAIAYDWESDRRIRESIIDSRERRRERIQKRRIERDLLRAKNTSTSSNGSATSRASQILGSAVSQAGAWLVKGKRALYGGYDENQTNNPSKDMHKLALIQRFEMVTETDAHAARAYLGRMNWRISDALACYYDDRSLLTALPDDLKRKVEDFMEGTSSRDAHYAMKFLEGNGWDQEKALIAFYEAHPPQSRCNAETKIEITSSPSSEPSSSILHGVSSHAINFATRVVKRLI